MLGTVLGAFLILPHLIFNSVSLILLLSHDTGEETGAHMDTGPRRPNSDSRPSHLAAESVR